MTVCYINVPIYNMNTKRGSLLFCCALLKKQGTKSLSEKCEQQQGDPYVVFLLMYDAYT